METDIKELLSISDETIQMLRDIYCSTPSTAKAILYIFAYGFEQGYESINNDTSTDFQLLSKEYYDCVVREKHLENETRRHIALYSIT